MNPMDYKEALDIALKKERASVELYRKLSIEHAAIRDLCEFLMNEEEKHVKMINGKISELYR